MRGWPVKMTGSELLVILLLASRPIPAQPHLSLASVEAGVNNERTIWSIWLDPSKPKCCLFSFSPVNQCCPRLCHPRYWFIALKVYRILHPTIGGSFLLATLCLKRCNLLFYFVNIHPLVKESLSELDLNSIGRDFSQIYTGWVNSSFIYPYYLKVCRLSVKQAKMWFVYLAPTTCEVRFLLSVFLKSFWFWFVYFL